MNEKQIGEKAAILFIQRFGSLHENHMQEMTVFFYTSHEQYEYQIKNIPFKRASTMTNFFRKKYNWLSVVEQDFNPKYSRYLFEFKASINYGSGSQPSPCCNPLITVPHIVVTPNNKIIFIATS